MARLPFIKLLILILSLAFCTPAAWAGPGSGHHPLRAKRVAGSLPEAVDAPIWEEAAPLTLALIFINDVEWTNAIGHSAAPTAGEEADAGGIMEARAIHNGEDIAIRLSWADPTESRQMADADSFPDGASVAFDAKLMCHMGSLSNPENIWNLWYWRADGDRAENLLSAGVGTITRAPGAQLEAQSAWSEGRWAVMLTRPLASSDPATQVDLRGGNADVRFARWDGGRAQRDGKKWITMSARLVLR